jgi:hypothetical protein
MKDIKATAVAIGFHCKIALKGLARMIFGAGTTGILALAVYGYITVSDESGWAAVCDFVAASALLFMGLICMYVQGGTGKRTNNGGNKRC